MKFSFHKLELKLFVTFFLLTFVTGVTMMHLLGTVTQLTEVFDTHREVISNLEKYVYKEKSRIDKIKRYANRLEAQQKCMANYEKHSANPFSYSELLKSLTIELDFIMELAGNHSLYKRNETLKYPTTKDMENAIRALVRLQSTYWLNVTELTQGILNGHFSTPLTSSDCFEVGSLMMKTNDCVTALQWFAEALDKTNRDDEQNKPRQIIEHIWTCYHRMGTLEELKHWSNLKNFYSRKENILTRLRKRVAASVAKLRAKQMQKSQEFSNKRGSKGIYKDLMLNRFFALCRGDIEFPPSIGKRLACRFLTDTHPFLSLAPVKLEQLYLDPSVILLHDMISDHEIQHLMDISYAKLSLSELVEDPTKPTAATENANHRHSSVAWLGDELSDVVAGLSCRVSHVTDLDVQLAEPLQVSMYGIGGHFLPHHDFPKIPGALVPITGGRIATVMFYLSEVEQGGATVFTELGLTVYPKKGSALVWMNYHPSGAWDRRTFHGGCPVLRGSKWVANKWLHEAGQELKRPCPAVSK